MALSGTFATMPLPHLLQWVAESRQSGLLTVVLDLHERHLELETGMIVAVGSEEVLTPDFARLAMADGVDGAQLERVAALAGRTGRSLGDLLVEQGHLHRPALDHLVRTFVEDSLWQLFLWHEGRFVFTEVRPERTTGGVWTGLLPVEPPVDAREVLMDGMRRLDEWRRMAAVIPTDYTLVHALGPTPDLPHLDALRRAGEPMSVGDLCVATGQPRRAVVEQLYEAYRRGLLAVDSGLAPAEQTGPGPADRLRQTALALIAAHQFDEAATLLRSALDLDPYHAAARADLRRCRAEQVDQLRAQFPADAVPAARPEIGQVGQSGLLERRERYLLSRINGRRDVRQLVEAAALSELETLRALRKLHHAGLITV